MFLFLIYVVCLGVCLEAVTLSRCKTKKEVSVKPYIYWCLW